jgi:hypothetical protein
VLVHAPTNQKIETESNAECIWRVLRPLPGIKGATARANGKWFEILGVPVALPRAVITDGYSMRTLHLGRWSVIF